MPDYQKMYTILCLAASDALDWLAPTPENEAVIFRLKTAMNEAEDVYIEE